MSESDEQAKASDEESRPIPTLWTTVATRETPRGALSSIDGLSDQQLLEVAQRAVRESQEQLEELLRPYKTPVSDETLRQILD